MGQTFYTKITGSEIMKHRIKYLKRHWNIHCPFLYENESVFQNGNYIEYKAKRSFNEKVCWKSIEEVRYLSEQCIG